ncbi:hypothetical protein [Paenibacillus sp. IITD108]
MPPKLNGRTDAFEADFREFRNEYSSPEARAILLQATLNKWGLAS